MLEEQKARGWPNLVRVRLLIANLIHVRNLAGAGIAEV